MTLGRLLVTRDVQHSLDHPDLESTFDRLQATGAEVVQEPMDQMYGRDCAFRDPAGNMIRTIQAPG